MVYFSRSAEKDIKRLPCRAIEIMQKDCVPAITSNLYAGKALHGPLRGYFSYDFHSSGISYRIAYEIIKSDALILMIDTRDNFYKKFSRRVR